MKIKLMDFSNAIIPLTLTFLTCGLYYLWWVFKTSQDINTRLDRRQFNPMVEALCTGATCGLWTFWWDWRVAQAVVEIDKRENSPPSMSAQDLFLSAIVSMGPFFFQAILNDGKGLRTLEF